MLLCLESIIFLENPNLFNLRHFIEIFADPSIVFMALSSTDGVQGWWSQDSKMPSSEGGKAYVNFGKKYKNVFKVERLAKDEICWLAEKGDPEWVGTRIRFSLENSETMVTVRFSHEAWREETDFYAACNLQWAHYLLSLKNYCEVGRGKPYGR